MLTQGQKLKKITKLCQGIISVGCEGGMKVFKPRYEELQNLLTRWENKEDISLLHGQCDYLLGDDSGSGNGSLEVEPSVEQEDMKIDEDNDDVLKEIKVAPTVLKRGRPKGAELTVICLPKKKSRKGVIPFTKLPAAEKDRLLLECFIAQNTANKVIKWLWINIA